MSTLSRRPSRRSRRRPTTRPRRPETRRSEGKPAARKAAEAIEELEALEASIAETATAVEDRRRPGRRIDEIASVIDGIAEETNLLALNASIEAARAEGSGDGSRSSPTTR